MFGTRSNPTPADHVLLLTVSAVLIVLTRVTPFAYVNDPWIDEAMLIANLPLRSWAELFAPLPLFEQAAPVLYLACLNLIALAFPDPAALVPALRALSAAESLVSGWLIYLTLRRYNDGVVTVLGLVFACLTPQAINYALEIKHYPFEYFATCLMLYAGARAAGELSRRTILMFVLSGAVTILAAYAAPIVIGAVGLGVIVQHLARGDGMRRLWPFVIACFGLAAAFVAWYLAVTRPQTALQFGAYREIYQPGMLGLPFDERWMRLPRTLAEQTRLKGPLTHWTVLCWPVYIVGLAVAVRRAAFVPVAFVTMIVMIYGLSLAGVLPIVFGRHFVFMIPVTAIVFAFGLAGLGRWAAGLLFGGRSGAAMYLGAAVAVMVAGGLALQRSDDSLQAENVTPLIAHILADADADKPVWVYYAAQPVMRVMAPPEVNQIGLLSHASQIPTWLSQANEYPDFRTSDAYLGRMHATLLGRHTVWLVFTHFWAEERFRGGLGDFRRIAEAELGACQDVALAGRAVLWKCGTP